MLHRKTIKSMQSTMLDSEFAWQSLSFTLHFPTLRSYKFHFTLFTFTSISKPKELCELAWWVKNENGFHLIQLKKNTYKFRAGRNRDSKLAGRLGMQQQYLYRQCYGYRTFHGDAGWLNYDMTHS